MISVIGTVFQTFRKLYRVLSLNCLGWRQHNNKGIVPESASLRRDLAREKAPSESVVGTSIKTKLSPGSSALIRTFWLVVHLEHQRELWVSQQKSIGSRKYSSPYEIAVVSSHYSVIVDLLS